MAQSTARPEAAVDLQMVREFLERYFTIENDIKDLQQDKSALRDEFKEAGAGHLAERLETTIVAVRNDDRTSAAALLRAMTAARLFDRMLTLEVAANLLSATNSAYESNSEQEAEAE